MTTSAAPVPSAAPDLPAPAPPPPASGVPVAPALPGRARLRTRADDGKNRRLVSSGRAHRVLRGVLWVGPQPGLTQRAVVALATLPGPAVLSHTTAASLWGWKLDEAVLHVTLPTEAGRRAGQRKGLVVHHRHLVPDQIVKKGVVRVTSRSRTVLDLLATLPETDAVWFWEQRLKEASSAELVREVTAAARGRAAARVARARVLSGSWLETHARLALVRAGIPEPTLQHPVLDDKGEILFRIDATWPEVRFGNEYDGKDHEQQKAADRHRQNDIVGRAGIELARFTYADVVHGERAFTDAVAGALLARGMKLPRRRRPRSRRPAITQ